MCDDIEMSPKSSSCASPTTIRHSTKITFPGSKGDYGKRVRERDKVVNSGGGRETSGRTPRSHSDRGNSRVGPVAL